MLATVLAPIMDVAAQAPLRFSSATIKPGIKATASIPLDFDGDGYSEVGTTIEGTRSTLISVVKSSDNTTLNKTYPGGSKAVPGDYDDDGKTDFAVVAKIKKHYHWTIELSSTEETEEIDFGASSGSPLSGCRLISAYKSSLAIIGDRRVTALEYDGTVAEVIKYPNGANLELIGCGDLDGDNIDELLFRLPGTNGASDSLVTTGCAKRPLTYRNVDPYKTALMLPRDAGLLPGIAFLRGTKNRRSLTVQGLSEILSFPPAAFSKFTDVSTAMMRGPSGTATSTVLWREPGARNIVAVYDGDRTATPAAVRSVSSADERLLQFQRIVK